MKLKRLWTQVSQHASRLGTAMQMVVHPAKQPAGSQGVVVQFAMGYPQTGIARVVPTLSYR